MKRTKNRIKSTFATCADTPETPVNPSAPLIRAMTRKIIAHFNIQLPPYFLTTNPEISEIKNKMMKITNKTLAISVATPAIPPKPSTAAMIAMIKNMTAQFNINIS